MSKSITMQDVDIYYGTFKAVEGVSLKVEPNSELELVVGGVRLAFVDATTDESVEVVLRLDIEDDFSFTADRQAGE